MSMEKLKEEYWKVIAKTRQSGRISDSVKAKEEQYWDAFPEQVVRQALEIHIKNYSGYRESYTRGIMRNINKKLQVAGKPVSKPGNKFSNFNQRNYTEADYAALERKLLGLE